MLRGVLYKEKELKIEECPIPEIGDGDVLIKNKISTTCGTDVKTYFRGYPLLKPPHPFGHEFSGVIEAAGKNVRGFKAGDRVAVHNTAPCNECFYCKRGLHSLCENMLFNRGAYANYVRVPERIVRQNMLLLDDSMSHKTASLMEPLSCAVYGIANCPIEQGDTVIINGVGPIGLMFVKLAALQGARVLATDFSDERLKLAEKLGAWKTFNAKGISDLFELMKPYCNDGRGADIVIEATGIIDVWNSSVKMARKGGFVLLFGGTKSNCVLNVDAQLLHYSQITVKGVFHTTPRHVETAFNLLKMGVIDEKDFVQKEYKLMDLEKAILEHAEQKVVKNCIVYE